MICFTNHQRRGRENDYQHIGGNAMKTDCFAWHRNKCLALNPDHAHCEGCLFYKSRAQNDAEQARVYEIIAAKPIEEQRYLADRYHQHKMPWKGAPAHDR
jgi:hypothetical protein